MATPIRLKALLRRRHWQTYRAFKVEYDRAAREVDPALVGTWPSRAQLHRWMSGDIKGLPFPDHCRVLEAMFPGWSAEQLFDPDPDPEGEHIDQPTPATTQLFWERPDVVAALSKKDVGTVLRLYRKHTGTSQAALSTLLELPQPDLAALEQHRYQADASDALDQVAARLRIPPQRSAPSDESDDSYPGAPTVSAHLHQHATTSGIVQLYPNRNLISPTLWDRLLSQASSEVGILVYVGMFLTEKPNLLPELRSKARAGARVRLMLGEAGCVAVEQRSEDEGIGRHTISAKINHALAFFRPLAAEPGIEIRTHDTVLYNSIYIYDGDMIVNPHIYGKTAPHSPAVHLRSTGDGDPFSVYAESFEAVWRIAKPL